MTRKGNVSAKTLRKQQEREALVEAEIGKLKSQLGMKLAHDLLESELTGVYDELDKLCKKAANEPVTQLQLSIVNNIIQQTKLLLRGDMVIDDIHMFVAAGDNPEYRDVVVVLRQLRQGLDRFKAGHHSWWTYEFGKQLDTYGVTEQDAVDFFKSISERNHGSIESSSESSN